MPTNNDLIKRDQRILRKDGKISAGRNSLFLPADQVFSMNQ